MNLQEWINLIRLCKTEKEVTGLILDGIIEEFIYKNGTIEFKDKFKLIKVQLFLVKYQKYWSLEKRCYTRRLKRGKDLREKKVVRKPYGSIKEGIFGRYSIHDLKRDHDVKIISKNPLKNYGLVELKINGFRLRIFERDGEYWCRVHVKYKLKNCKNELFNLAFNNADCKPRKGKYVTFIEFTTDNNPEEKLLYLSKIISLWK